ncbi:MAG: sterol desaturase family protein [Alphaproteobacteria bacterium]|nr:sterol desaturase family protein [Alphaproteobacteria bacterium]
MLAWLTAHEPTVRLSAFFGVFLVMALLELVAARRPLTVPKGRRWLANLGLVVANTVVLRVLFPTAAVGAAAWAASQGWGVLPLLGLPHGLTVLLAVLLLDFAIYLQHVMFHAVPVLWRLHAVHHADHDLDVTSGLRFHPVEILLSMGIKLGLVTLLGAPVEAVLIFEVVLNAAAMFNHANVALPATVDRVLRWVLVTPDMHRVHHSVIPSETNSNFGFNAPWWDRLCGTYRAQPAAGHLGMTLGLDHLPEPRVQGLGWMLALPFRRGTTGAYDLGHRDT